MNNRRGFALLTVLWMTVVLAAVTAEALSLARAGHSASANRVLLRRAEWAREACGEMLIARYSRAEPLRGVDTVDLGRGTWCRAAVEDPAAKLNLNLAESASLRIVLGSDSLVRAVLARRDSSRRSAGEGAKAIRTFLSVDQLAELGGFDAATVERLRPLLTVGGSGQVNVNLAPEPVLRTLPGLDSATIERLLHRRSLRPIQRMEELAAALGSRPGTQATSHYAELAATVSFAPSELVATIEGGVRGNVIRAEAGLTLAPAGERLAVIARWSE